MNAEPHETSQQRRDEATVAVMMASVRSNPCPASRHPCSLRDRWATVNATRKPASAVLPNCRTPGTDGQVVRVSAGVDAQLREAQAHAAGGTAFSGVHEHPLAGVAGEVEHLVVEGELA